MQLQKRLFQTYLILIASWTGFAVIKDKVEFGYVAIAPSLPIEISRIQRVDSVTFFKPGYKPSKQSYDEHVGGFWRYRDEYNLGDTGYVGSSRCNKEKCQASRVLVALYEMGLLSGNEDEQRLTSPDLQELHTQLKKSELIESRNISLETLTQSAGIVIEAQEIQDSYVFLAYYGRNHGVANETNGVFSNIFRYGRSPYYEILLKRNQAKNTLVPIKASSFFHGGNHAFSFLNLFITVFLLSVAMAWLLISIKLLSQYTKAVTDVYRRSRQNTQIPPLSDDVEGE